MQSRFLALLLGALLLVGIAPATIISTWDLTPFAGDDIGVNVVVRDIGSSTLEITASVVPFGANDTGDLLGLFFNIDPGLFSGDPTPTEATVKSWFTGDELSNVCFGPDLDTCGPGNLVNPLSQIPDLPAGSFHVGFLFGGPGSASGNIMSTVISFDYAALGTMPVLGPFAARVQSVGANGEGSSKLYAGEPNPDTPGGEVIIPEPSTWLLLGGALLALGMARRSRKA